MVEQNKQSDELTSDTRKFFFLTIFGHVIDLIKTNN